MGQLILLAALGHRQVIGRDNDLPWHLPEDLQRFKSITTGKVVVMGRKTFESIVGRLGRPLPDRHSVVLTRDPQWRPAWTKQDQKAQVSVLHSLAELRSLSPGDIYVIGGAELYAATLSMADRLDITEVEVDTPGDAFFPAIDPGVWARHSGPEFQSAASGLRYRFVQYTRR